MLNSNSEYKTVHERGKSVKNKALVIIGVIVLCIGVGGLYVYNEFFRSNPEVQQELTDQFGEDFFTSFDEGDNDTDDSGTVNDGESIAESINEATEGSVDGQNNQGEGPPNPASSDNTQGNKTITQSEITHKYEPQFNRLQNVAVGRLNTLYSSAIQEYKAQKKAGTLNTSKLAQKYIQAGTSLEANIDAEFYSALSAMESELKANHHSTDVINVYKSEYESMKSSKRSELLSNIR